MGGSEELRPGGFLPPVDPGPSPAPPAPPAPGPDRAPGPPPPRGPVLATWWSRAGAALLDGLILLPLFFLAAAVGDVRLVDRDDPWGGIDAGELLGLQIWTACCFAVYHCTLLLMWEGQTVGKRMLGVRVVRADLAPLQPRDVLIRQALVQGLVGSFIAVVALVDYLWPVFDRENRALHDMAADTRVVQARA